MAKLTILPKTFETLDANDPKCCFRINIDVLNAAFGVGRGMYARACYPDKKDTFFLGTNPEDKFFIWMPKLYGNSSEWKNVVRNKGEEIHEIAEETRHEDWFTGDDTLPNAGLRLVFAKASPSTPYRFLGVYQNDKMDFCDHSYKRIATKIRLIGNPVSKIELLDDKR